MCWWWMRRWKMSWNDFLFQLVFNLRAARTTWARLSAQNFIYILFFFRVSSKVTKARINFRCRLTSFLQEFKSFCVYLFSFLEIRATVAKYFRWKQSDDFINYAKQFGNLHLQQFCRWFVVTVDSILFQPTQVGVMEDKTMSGKTVIVTGANAGIGVETVRDIAKRGARVIMACRNLLAANQARG